MNNYKNINVPVKRNGTTQRERFPDALQPGYILVDERSKEDLVRFIARYAKNLRYFNPDNEEDGTWEAFFNENPTEEEKQSPHFALMLAFLELFKRSQEHLNTFTKRHLDFYYKDVLQFTKDKAQPDHVHLIFELARHIPKHSLKAGTLFKAGKDPEGNDIYYRLAADTELGQAKITDVKTVYLEKDVLEIDVEEEIEGKLVLVKYPLHKVDDIYAAENQPGDTVKTLGSATLPPADIGFAITAPILSMREGERKVSITIEGVFEGDEHWLDYLPEPETLQDALKLQFSGEKTWITTAPVALTIEKGETPVELILSLEATLDKNQPPVVSFNAKHLEGTFDTVWPVVKILLRSGGSYPYHILKDFVVNKTEINVDVKEVKQLLLQNDFAELNPDKPFIAFGTEPGVGANLYIGSREVFQKELESLDIHMQWYNVPDDDLGAHYQEYNIEENGVVLNPRDNEDFKVDISILKNKDWITLGEDVSIFGDDAREAVTIHIESGNIETDEATGFEELKPYNIDSVRGFVKLTLKEPDFGHKEYPNLYTEAITDINNNVPNATLPKAPYTPTLQSISLDYSARKEIDILNDEKHLYHLHPFGWSPHTVRDDTPYLLPYYEGEGNLFVGIENLSPPCELSVLFHVVEGTANPDSHKPGINWSYLSGDQWFPLEGPAILRNSTDSFNSPGIITFAIPAEANNQNRTLETGKYWLRANTAKDSDGAAILTDIRAQAAAVTEVIDENHISEINEPLAPGSIEKMVKKDPFVKSIEQPYTSVHGKGNENDKAFYTRVSERLRHKKRALTAWDYERLALERFPSLYKAKCYHHASLQQGDTPGSILLIIIPNLQNNPAINPLQPMASLGLQEQVKTFLQELAQPQTRIEVRNPIFEIVCVEFLVKFREGYNNGYYEKQLQDELRKFLSPWAYSESKDINLGGRIYKSSLLNFVEERPYVDYATFFKMDHVDTEGNIRVNVEEAEAMSPISVLTSAAMHNITVLNDEGALCADGIGHMIIETNFITIK